MLFANNRVISQAVLAQSGNNLNTEWIAGLNYGNRKNQGAY